ncbi:MAG: (2Fe-2S) ferredoxin domain-containing protein [Candidatus Obscuribacterales bacterium]|nr:(2Fe-2S) ferredoxin domain-containing protein [Candidatus Obscuribacterales bacterium]
MADLNQSALEAARLDVYRKHVFVCLNEKPCGQAGSAEVLDTLRKEIAVRGLKKEIRINKAGCFDACGHGPLVVVYPDSVWYAHVKPEDCVEIIESHLLGNKPVTRLLYDGSGRIT